MRWGIQKLLQDIAQIVGAALPVYTVVRFGLGHLPYFTCIVELTKLRYTSVSDGPSTNQSSR